MPAIESVLGIMLRLGADELRLGTNQPPRVFAHGAQKRLSIEDTSDAELRHLLGSILTEERERQMVREGQIDVLYESPELGPFHVVLAERPEDSPTGPGFDAVVRVGGRPTAGSPGSGPGPGNRAPLTIPTSVTVELPPEAPTLPSQPMTLMRESASRSVSMRSGRLATLLGRAVHARASDVHVQTGAPPSLRIDGRLQTLHDDAPVDVEQLLEGIVPLEAFGRIRQGLSQDFGFELGGTGRFRANVYQASEGLSAAIRLLPAAAPELHRLELPVSVSDLVDLPHGLVIVCGPTGSGKSTTLAALAQAALARRSIVLISLEDPIEYVLRAPANGSVVRQRQIGRDVRDFPAGLRDALREDPDLLVIGEMRDPESISLTLTAAETGHLVLASMHSRSAVSAVERAIDAYPPERQQQVRVQLADSLRAVLSQRLLRRERGTGRIPALEVLRVNHSVASQIREGRTPQIMTALQSGRKEGMLQLERCLADMVLAGKIQLEDARAVANDPDSLAGYLKG